MLRFMVLTFLSDGFAQTDRRDIEGLAVLCDRPASDNDALLAQQVGNLGVGQGFLLVFVLNVKSLE